MSVVQLLLGDHLPGKTGNVRKFDSCQGNIMEFGKSQPGKKSASPRDMSGSQHYVNAGVPRPLSLSLPRP